MSNDNPVVHFEMPYDDGQRVAKFYGDVFGWGMQVTGEEMGNYITAQTAETDENRMVKTPGTINGGFFPKKPDSPNSNIVIMVKDLQTAVQKISAAGGAVQGDPVEIPGIGAYIYFTDTEGNRVSLLQPAS